MIGADRNNSDGFMPSQEEIDNNVAAIKDALYEEMVCYSSSNAEANYCSIIDPAPGQYWIATANLGGIRGENYRETMHYAVIGEDKTQVILILLVLRHMTVMAIIRWK